MIHILKVTSYALIILFLFVSIPNSQAFCRDCACYTQEDTDSGLGCRSQAKAQGLQLGGAGYDFAGPYGTKGCYSYDSGKYKGRAYFGTGGTKEEMAAVPAPPKYRIPCAPSAPSMPPPVGEHHDPNMQPGLAVNSEVEGDSQCNTPEACADAAAAEGLTYVDAKPNRGTMGCYAYSSGKYAGSVYFGKGGTDEENNAVPNPPKYRFCGPNKTDTSSAWYIEAEREVTCISDAYDACKESFGPGWSSSLCSKGHEFVMEKMLNKSDTTRQIYVKVFNSCMAGN